jgi:hypothetical protein
MKKHVQKDGRKPLDARFCEEIKNIAYALELIEIKIEDSKRKINKDIAFHKGLVKWQDELMKKMDPDYKK